MKFKAILELVSINNLGKVSSGSNITSVGSEMSSKDGDPRHSHPIIRKDGKVTGHGPATGGPHHTHKTTPTLLLESDGHTHKIN